MDKAHHKISFLSNCEEGWTSQKHVFKEMFSSYHTIHNLSC